MRRSGLHLAAVSLCVGTLMVIAAGATVTSNQAGLSISDFPLSHGQVIAPLTTFQGAHRFLTQVVGLLAIVVAIWAAVVDRRSWPAWLAYGVVAAIVFEAVLGGITVLQELPTSLRIMHAVAAHLLFALTAALAAVTSARWQAPPTMVDDHGSPSLRVISEVLPLIVLVQIGLGAAYRHGLFGLAPHVTGAVLVAALGILIAFTVSHGPARHLRARANTLTVLLAAQVVLGATAYFIKAAFLAGREGPWIMLAATMIHVTVGAAALGAATVMAMHAARSVRRVSTHVSHGSATAG